MYDRTPNSIHVNAPKLAQTSASTKIQLNNMISLGFAVRSKFSGKYFMAIPNINPTVTTIALT